jgi:hypothetical protein
MLDLAPMKLFSAVVAVGAVPSAKGNGKSGMRKGNGSAFPLATKRRCGDCRRHTYNTSTSPDSRVVAGCIASRSPFRTRLGTAWRMRSS